MSNAKNNLNVSPATKSNMLSPNNTLNTGSSTGNPRNKIALKPGRSMVDWMRWHRNAPDPSGTGGKLHNITLEELSKHDKEDDAWMALNGRVYNVTPYMEFHPGGVKELMRGGGIDGTALFNEVHRWVNYESMLKRCCVGILLPTISTTHLHGSTTSLNKSLAVAGGSVNKSKSDFNVSSVGVINNSPIPISYINRLPNSTINLFSNDYNNPDSASNLNNCLPSSTTTLDNSSGLMVNYNNSSVSATNLDNNSTISTSNLNNNFPNSTLNLNTSSNSTTNLNNLPGSLTHLNNNSPDSTSNLNSSSVSATNINNLPVSTTELYSHNSSVSATNISNLPGSTIIFNNNTLGSTSNLNSSSVSATDLNINNSTTGLHDQPTVKILSASENNITNEIRTASTAMPDSITTSANSILLFGNAVIPKKPRYSWCQKSDKVIISVTTHNAATVKRHHVIIDKYDLNVIIHIIITDYVFIININFEDDVSNDYTVVPSTSSLDDIDIIFNKLIAGKFWTLLGTCNESDASWTRFSVADLMYRKGRLLEKRQLTHDTYLFTIELPSNTRCCIPIGCHVFLQLLLEEFTFSKPYTVVPNCLFDDADDNHKDINNNSADKNDDNNQVNNPNNNYVKVDFKTQGNQQQISGQHQHHHHHRKKYRNQQQQQQHQQQQQQQQQHVVDPVHNENNQLCFIIKIYNDGMFTPALNKLSINDEIDISYIYSGLKFEEQHLWNLSNFKQIILIAAGTGLTPMIGVIRYYRRLVKENLVDEESRDVRLLFFNKTERDITLREDLNEFVRKHKWFSTTHILSAPDETWKGLKGRICKEILISSINKENLTIDNNVNNEHCLFCMCGPPAFSKSASRILKEMNCTDNQVYVFAD